MRQPRTDETALLSSEDNGQPPYLYPDYVARRLRAPKKPLIILPKMLSDTTGPAYGHEPVGELDSDLTRQHEDEPLGERITPELLFQALLTDDAQEVRFERVAAG